MIRKILQLGDPRLYEASWDVTRDDIPALPGWIADLHDTLMDYRKTYGAGRAIAAPQIGLQKRLIYLHIGDPLVLINPDLSFPDTETCTLLDDCMSFPGLAVRVTRYKRADILYLDDTFHPRRTRLSGDLSELLQHEYDHLDGILSTMRAVDNKSFFLQQIKREFE